MRTKAERILRTGEKWLVYLIEDVPLSRYLLAFVIVVVIFGWAYSLLTPYGHGLANESGALCTCGFGDGVYFSVVTITSLGYGELRPVGTSKAIACAEVIFGLAWMGVLVAKITSRRLSYHVQRLFSTDAQRRLEEYIGHFESINTGLSTSMRSLGTAFTTTPGEKGQPQDGKADALVSFKQTLGSLNMKSAGLAEYLSREADEADYFAVVPTEAIVRLLKTVSNALMVLGQLIISLLPEARTEVLDYENRQHIAQTLASHRGLCQTIKDHSKVATIRESAERVLETCEGVPESYFAVPAIVAAARQPDQIPLPSVEPQEPENPQPQP